MKKLTFLIMVLMFVTSCGLNTFEYPEDRGPVLVFVKTSDLPMVKTYHTVTNPGVILTEIRAREAYFLQPRGDWVSQCDNIDDSLICWYEIK